MTIHSLVLFATRNSDQCTPARGKIKSCRCYALGLSAELDTHTSRSMIKQSRETLSIHLCFPFPPGHLQGGDTDKEKIVINYYLFWARMGWRGERKSMSHTATVCIQMLEARQITSRPAWLFEALCPSVMDYLI